MHVGKREKERDENGVFQCVHTSLYMHACVKY